MFLSQGIFTTNGGARVALEISTCGKHRQKAAPESARKRQGAVQYYRGQREPFTLLCCLFLMRRRGCCDCSGSLRRQENSGSKTYQLSSQSQDQESSQHG